MALPLSLRCDALNTSLREVISRCRDYAVSQHLVHYFRSTSMAQRGAKVPGNTLTTNFCKARDKTDIDWGDGTPATFHEQRSLAERLYRKQGVNTKNLLGHKHLRMTDYYNDERGKNWVIID